LKVLAGGTKQSFSGEDGHDLRRLLAALEPFRELDESIPLGQIVAYLLVATEEGLSVNEYGQRGGFAQSVASRHPSDIGEYNRYHKPGHQLIKGTPDLMNRRRRIHTLTPMGTALGHRILRALRLGRRAEAEAK
jgi:hypothetical protein